MWLPGTTKLALSSNYPLRMEKERRKKRHDGLKMQVSFLKFYRKRLTIHHLPNCGQLLLKQAHLK